MDLDILHSILQVTIALGQVHLEQVPQQVLKISSEVGRKTNLLVNIHMYVIYLCPQYYIYIYYIKGIISVNLCLLLKLSNTQAHSRNNKYRNYSSTDKL